MRRLITLLTLLAVAMTALPRAAAGPPRERWPFGTAGIEQLHWSAGRVQAGKSVTVTGRVRPATSGRPVHLEQNLAGRWTQVAGTTTSRGGLFTLTVPTQYLQNPAVTYRVAVEGQLLSAGATSATHAVRVRPPYHPIGSRRSWSRLEPGSNWRLSCAPLTYRVNPAHLPRGADQDIAKAMSQLTRATGIASRYLGRTDHRGQSTKAWPADTTLVIAWLDPKQSTRRPFGVDSAYGGPLQGVWVQGAQGREVQTTRAVVVMKTGLHLKGGFASNSRGTLLLHELGHVAGLGHVLQHPGQIMSYDSRIGRYQAGDLAGLRAVGRLSGCPGAPLQASGRSAGSPSESSDRPDARPATVAGPPPLG